MIESSAELDFTHARFTAVISDLHLCEAEPPHPLYPLWKKYKTRQFFFDDAFFEFLRHTHSMAGGEPIELVLNGDIFDFDSVLSVPEEPPYRISWIERYRGLHAEEERSVFKINRILDDHANWLNGLRWFLDQGHRAVFVIGNHDLELHWPAVQRALLGRLRLSASAAERVRFVEWFYISNKDTLIEHGNQYDPYCLCLDPVSPYVLQYNRVEIRLPFGNVACRYLINGMGYFNPHVDSNYLMSIPEYVRFFVKYMVRSQPLIIWTWFWGSFLTLIRSLIDNWRPSLKDPLHIEDRIDEIAQKANATPRMVRELKELFETPATWNPLIIARELWLDRAFLILMGLLVLLQIFFVIQNIFSVSMFWVFIPILIFLPFLLFYSRTVRSMVAYYKEPQERILGLSSKITHAKRIIYGHTHIVRHEVIGGVEHLNSGCWSPAFLDVECNKPIGQKTFVWIQPASDGGREARVYHFTGGESVGFFDKRQPKRKTLESRKNKSY